MIPKALPFILLFSIQFFYINLSAQWESMGDDIIPPGERVWSIKMAPDYSIWAVSTHDGSPAGQMPKVHRSADGGENWINAGISEAWSSRVWDISPLDSMNAFIAADNKGIHQTTDGGQNWNKVESGSRHPRKTCSTYS